MRWVSKFEEQAEATIADKWSHSLLLLLAEPVVQLDLPYHLDDGRQTHSQASNESQIPEAALQSFWWVPRTIAHCIDYPARKVDSASDSRVERVSETSDTEEDEEIDMIFCVISV